MKFSANLGFLWKELPLPEAIHAARNAGFDAVECHWPYDVEIADVNAALNETGLKMLGLNTSLGQEDQGDFGLAALPDRICEARKGIDQAIAYASAIDCKNIHVMAGNASGSKAHQTFIENLSYASELAAQHRITLLIEPLNCFDAPHYFLKTIEQAKAIINEVKADNLRLMFDCYHIARTEGDVMHHLQEMLPIIGHIQFAGVPDRGAPDQGTLDYSQVFALIKELGYDDPLGAEYRPSSTTLASLGWLKTYKDR